MLIVKKKDSPDFRICMDFRPPNHQTTKDALSAPRIDDTLLQLQKRFVFSELDVNSAYYNIDFYPDDRHKTAFRHESRLYEFNRLAFGLCNAPATWNRLIFKISPFKFGTVYLDDVTVSYQSVQEHEDHLEQVFKALRERHMTDTERPINVNSNATRSNTWD